MNVIINRKVLEEFVRSKIKEERSFHTKNISEIPAKDDDEPIVPREQMAVQLSADAPPVEDPEFIPASLVELGNAASVIAREVPSHQIEFFYRRLHKLLDEALDKEEERRMGVAEKTTGMVLRDDEKDLEKFQDKKEGDISETIKLIKSLLLEQDTLDEALGDDWEPEEDWEKEPWKEIEATGTEEKSIPRATSEIISYLKPIAGNKTVINPFSGLPGTKTRGGTETFISLTTLLGPEKVDPVVAQIFSKYSLTPEQIKIVRYAAVQEMMKYKMHKGETLLEPWTDTNWCPSQLALNQAADQIALGLMRGKKDPETKEWIVEPLSPEDAAHHLIKRSECFDPETDQGEIDAHQEIAMMILNKKGAAEELKARAESEREVKALQAQTAAAEKAAASPPKDLSDLWTQIAKEEGFSSAAGARQFAWKPLMKYYLESLVISPDVMDAVKSRALISFKRGLRSFDVGLDRSQLLQIIRSSRAVPVMTGDHFRTYFKLIFFQPFINDFLKVWKSAAGAILSEMGIQDPKQVFAKMLIGETSPTSKGAKAKILTAMTAIQFSQALEKSRAWAADPANSTNIARKYAQRIDDTVKVKNSIQKALSSPDV